MIQIMRADDATMNSIVPAQGQPAYGTTTHTLKIGDGTTTWENLPKIGEALQVVDIPAQADLNDYENPGWYRCPSNAMVQTLFNTPTNNAFFLEVGRHAGVYQRLVEYMTVSPRIFFRNYYYEGNPQWGSWYRVYSTADRPDLMDLPGVLHVSSGGTGATSAAGARVLLQAATNQLDGTTNPDNIVESGFYRLSEQEGAVYPYCQLIVSRGPDGDTIAQIAIPYDTGFGFPKLRFGNPPAVGGSGRWYGWYDIFTSQGQVPIANGGTGATTADAARANLGAAASSHTHFYLEPEGDNRNYATTPNDYHNSFAFRGIKTQNAIGTPSGSYAYLMGLRGWSDDSGGNSHELAFTNDGIYHRMGATTSWGGWAKLFTSWDAIPIANGGTGATSAQGIRTNLGMSGSPMYSLWNGASNLASQITISGIAANPGYNTFIFIFAEGYAGYRIPIAIPFSYIPDSRGTIFDVGDASTGAHIRFYAWKSSGNLYLLRYGYIGSGADLVAVYGRY